MKHLLTIALTIALLLFAITTARTSAHHLPVVPSTATRAELRSALEELLDRLDDMDDADADAPEPITA